MPDRKTKENDFELIPFQMHPRIFAALGSDLITNDIVAVIELVKNSYDAFAKNVWIRFYDNQADGRYIVIEDDGHGMTKEVIQNAWCIVATPFKENNPTIQSGNETRRVVGEKGLGRLSAARLGTKLRMFTKAPANPCWEVEVDWKDLYEGQTISSCNVKCRKSDGKDPFKRSGTIIHILDLKSEWNESKINDIEQNLSRMISPFLHLKSFNIFISDNDKLISEDKKVKSPEFLSNPKYTIKGEVDKKGFIKYKYTFNSISDDKSRERNFKLSWEQVCDKIQNPYTFDFKSEKLHCGPFSFEIRAWDISSEDTQEISDKYDIQKSQVKKAIQAHKGISIYRDGILVLPKSDNARDWLGLDLRRVSHVGPRLSTNQLVGYVLITAEDNPNIKDTSDRERLASSIEAAEFEEILLAIIAALEDARAEDRNKQERQVPMKDLFLGLSADKIVSDIEMLAEEGAEASKTVPIIRRFSKSLDTTRETIQERFVYYSRMATVGTIALMLVHEIRVRTIAFGGFMNYIFNKFGPFKEKEIINEYKLASSAIDALERLAETFAPLASRSFRRRKRDSILEERISLCMSLISGEIKNKSIKIRIPKTESNVAVDPGELDAILLNIINNAVYWLGQVPKTARIIEFDLRRDKTTNRIQVWIHDSGPGVHEDDLERIFWPGVTRKPDGIGMGLTVTSEIVAEYGGRMGLKAPGKLGGASFSFDLPLK